MENDVEMGVGLLYLLTWFLGKGGYDWRPDWSRRPLTAQIEQYLEAVGHRSPAFDLWYPHPVALRRFPNGSPFDRRPVPTLLTIGWWDNCAPWSWRDVDRIRRKPEWDASTYLRIESIDHENTAFVGEGDRSDRDRIVDILEPALDFFDVFVKRIGDAQEISRVTWNLAGTEGYRTSDTWPPAGLQSRSYVLTKDRTLAEWGHPYSSADADDDVLTWTHDPADPVPSSVPDEFSFLRYQPDEAAAAARNDVLAFTGPVEQRDVDLVGAVALSVRFQGSAPRNDLFARLYDRSPDGALHRIARGQRQFDGTDLHEATIDLGQLGYRLRAGHALQLHLQGSDYPEWVVQPGTGQEPWSATTLRTSTHTVGIGGVWAVLEMSTLPRS